MSSHKRDRFTQIGVDRLIRYRWLEQTAYLVLAGNDDATVKATLQAELKESFRSNNPDVRGSIDKSITILLKVWLRVPRSLESFRTSGLRLLERVSRPDHIAVHWGMMMAVYPFWANVAVQTGRLLRLQGSAVASQIQRRLREQYGERETVARRARYVLRSYLDWGVLAETTKKGVYAASPCLSVEDSSLIAWLIEASLHARANGSAPLKEVFASPVFFPFRLPHRNAESLLVGPSRLDIIRHGLDQDLVTLRAPDSKAAHHKLPGF